MSYCLKHQQSNLTPFFHAVAGGGDFLFTSKKQKNPFLNKQLTQFVYVYVFQNNSIHLNLLYIALYSENK
jgi:hypothetical protein